MTPQFNVLLRTTFLAEKKYKMNEMMTDIMRTRISQLEEENRTVRQELSELSTKLAETQAAMDALRVDAHQVIGQWAEDAKKSRLQCEEVMREKGELTQKIGLLEAKEHEIISINVSFGGKLQRLEKELEDAIRRGTEAAESAMEVSRLHADAIRAKDFDIESLRSELRHVEEMRTAAHGEAQRWEADCIDTLALVQSLRQERVVNAAREADLGNLLCTAEGSIATLTEQLTATKALLQASQDGEVQVEKLSKTLEEHVMLLAEAEEGRTAMQTEAQQLKGDLSIAAACIAKLQDDLQAQDVAAETLLRENTNIKTQLLAMAEEKSHLQSECTTMRRSLDDANLELREVKDAQSKAAARADDLESDVAEHLDTIESMKRVIQTLEGQMRWKSDECASLKETAESLQTEVEAVRSEFKREHTENLSLKAKVASSAALEAELRASMISTRAELEEKIKQSDIAVRTAEAAHAETQQAASQEIAAKESELQAISTALGEVKRCLSHAESTAARDAREAQLEISELRARDAISSSELTRLRERITFLEGDLEKSRTDIQRKAREAHDAREQQKMAEHMLSQAVLEQQELHDRSSSVADGLIVELRAAKRATESLKERCDAAENECNECRDELQRLRHVLISKDDELQRSKFERDSLYERNRNFEILLSQHSVVVEELESKLQAADSLRSEKRSLQQELAVLQNRVASFQDDHDRLIQSKDSTASKIDTELKIVKEQHQKLRSAFEEAKNRCAAAEESLSKSADEMNDVIRSRDEIILKFNALHDRYTQLKKQVSVGSAGQPCDLSQRRSIELEALLAKLSQICRDQEAQLSDLRNEHVLLQRAMNMTRTTTVALEEFHKSSGLSVQNLNTIEGPRRHPRKRSMSQHSDSSQRVRADSHSR